MAGEIIDLKKELNSLRFDMNFRQRINCSEEENNKYFKMTKNGESLPDGVYQYEDDSYHFYTIYDSGLTDAEKNELIQYKKLAYIKTIKNCIVFITLLPVISLIIAIITGALVK